MHPVNYEFKQMSKSINRQIGMKVLIDGVEYNNDKIVELDIENNLVSSEKFSLGNVISSRLNLTIRDFDLKAKENALVEPFVRFEGGFLWNEVNQAWEQVNVTWDFEYSEWMPLGKFFIDNRKFTNQRLWKLECYDKTMLLHQPYVSTLTYPQTMRNVLLEICNKIGLEIENINLINSSYLINQKPTDMTLHQILSYITSANCTNAFIAKNGKLKFIKFNSSIYSNPVETLTMRDYFRATQTNDAKKFTKLRMHEKDSYTEGEFAEKTRGAGDDFNTLDIINPFVTETMLNDMYQSLNGFEYIPYELDYKCFPHLELGDVITIEQSKGASWLEARDTWGTADFTWDFDIVSFNVILFYDKVVYRGGLRSTLKAEAESVQSSEFKVKGSLREYVEKVDKASIKEGIAYNNVSTSREEGFVAERSDKKAKTIMNATEGISIYSDVGNGLERNFFVDLNGRIQAQALDIIGDATFGGTISTTQDAVIGNNIYIGSMGQSFSKGIYFSQGNHKSEIVLDSSGRMQLFNWNDIDISCPNGNLTLSGNDIKIETWGGSVILDDWSYIGNNSTTDNMIATEGYVDSLLQQHIAEYH